MRNRFQWQLGDILSIRLTRPSKMTPFARRTVRLSFGLALLLSAVALFWRIGVQQGAARNAHTRSQLKMIGLAIANYRNEHGCFPPSIVRDSSGKPLYSWRVLILKYLDEPSFGDFVLKEPWDSSAHLSFARRIQSHAKRLFMSATESNGRPG